MHLMSMEFYGQELKSAGYEVKLLQYEELNSDDYLPEIIKSRQITAVHICEVIDQRLENLIQKVKNELKVSVHVHDSPGFLLNNEMVVNDFSSKKFHFMAKFYKKQRQRYGILIDEENKPIGGKWSFDEDNRKKLPKDIVPPQLKTFSYESNTFNKYEKKIAEHFSSHAGDVRNFNYPVTRKQAKNAFLDFLQARFELFGDYEDAISMNHTFNYHSVLTPYLNIGLITPREVLELTLDYAEDRKIRLNSLEGFIRQIIGWREFIRGIYQIEGEKQRTTNYWGFSQKLHPAFYSATTEIVPLDNAIKRTIKNAYCHHIERLMIIGNFMVLLKIHPDEVYRWFMEMFIDAYDWVMVPNVYGMSQYADGGLMSTKPYISGSNYILKMSDYKKGEWCQIWDSLYWRFIDENRDFFLKNPRMSMMVSMYDKKDENKKIEYYNIINNNKIAQNAQKVFDN